MQKITLLMFFAFFSVCASAQLQISGKLRVLRPLTLKVEDLNGKILFECKIENSKEFSTPKLDIVPDVYKLSIGERDEMVIFENKPVTLKGFLNDKNPTNGSFITTGMELRDEALTCDEAFRKSKYNIENIRSKNPLVQALLIYKYTDQIKAYEPFKEIYDLLDKNGAQIVNYFAAAVKQRESFKIGGEAVEFTLLDQNNKEVSLSDFKGKIVLIDFWASWCGPCRAEMVSLRKIYGEIKGDDLVFISISLDDSREKWLQATKDNKVEWVSLWDKDAFKNTKFRKLFGFDSIPFIVLLDKEGKTIVRKLRGEDIKLAIEKERKK